MPPQAVAKKVRSEPRLPFIELAVSFSITPQYIHLSPDVLPRDADGTDNSCSESKYADNKEETSND